MALRDLSLIDWLESDHVAIRSAALEILSHGFTTDPRWMQAIFAAWDRYTPQEAFPEFPLLTHLEIGSENLTETLQRASLMVRSLPITDRACRCAGKIIEALSVGAPSVFAKHVGQIKELKNESKIFFRIDIDRLSYRAELSNDENLERIEEWFEHEVAPPLPYGVYPHLEANFLKGQADEALNIGFRQLHQAPRVSFVLEACFELATRYRLLGFESIFAAGLDDENSSIADACAVALARCRNDQVLSLIADRFAGYSRPGQLRSIDVLRRMRLPKTSELLRFLRVPAQDTGVQNALRVSEILQFDFADLENWLEAFLIVDDASLDRISPFLALVGPLSELLSQQDRDRTRHLVRTRLQKFDY